MVECVFVAYVRSYFEKNILFLICMESSNFDIAGRRNRTHGPSVIKQLCHLYVASYQQKVTQLPQEQFRRHL